MKCRLQNQGPNENALLSSFFIITLLQRVQKVSHQIKLQYFENTGKSTMIILQFFPFLICACLYMNFSIYFKLHICIHIDTNIIPMT